MLREVAGVRLNVVDEGAGAPVLFLHGVGGSWRHFEPQLDRLSSRYRCIAVDQRGFGQSDRAGGYSIDVLADDAAALCESLGIGPVYVVGLSMGGMVAQALALRHPALVHAMVLSNTTGYSDPALRDLVRATCDVVRGGGLLGFLEASKPMTWAPRTLAERPELARSFTREQAGNDPDVYAAILEDISGLDHRPLLSGVKAPALVVRGEHDAMTPVEHTATLLELIPDASELVLADAGHMSPLEAPDEFTAAVVSFFESHPMPGAG